jgi:hypothetical protein
VKYARPPGEIVTGISLMAQGYRAATRGSFCATSGL